MGCLANALLIGVIAVPVLLLLGIVFGTFKIIFHIISLPFILLSKLLRLFF